MHGLHKWNAEHRLGKFGLKVTFEPRQCSAFQICITARLFKLRIEDIFDDNGKS